MSLGKFVLKIRKEKNLSVIDVSNRSALFGKRISGSYINRIETDPKRQVTANRLLALANGLGVPPQELFALAAGLESGESSDEVHLLTCFRELSPERRADLLGIVDTLYQREKDESKDIRV